MFKIHGPNGIHQCLVLDLGGPSLQRLTLYCKRPSLPFLQEAAKTLAEGLAALHKAGVCHGDLTDTNVLLEITGVQNWTEDEIYRYLGDPKTEPLLLLLDGTPAPGFAPSHVVDALDYSNFNMEHLSSNILIADFGEAFFKDNVPKGLGTPAFFSAPELLFGYPPSSAADLWALGCLIFQIHTSQFLFPAIFGSEEALALAIETVGALPETWHDFYVDEDGLAEFTLPNKKHRWFDGKIERARMLDSQILDKVPELSPNQHTTFLKLLKRILVFEPSRRIPAAEVAKDSWFIIQDLQAKPDAFTSPIIQSK